MQMNKLLVYPAQWAIGEELEVRVPDPGTILKSVGSVAVWILISVLTGWGLFGLVHSLMGPLSAEASRLFVSFLIVPFLAAGIYFILSLWHYWIWSGEQESWNWVSLGYNASVFAMLSCILSGLTFLLVLPWFSYSPLPGYLLWLNGILVALLVVPVCTVLTLVPIFFESEHPSALRSIATAAHRVLNARLILVMSLLLVVSVALTIISFGIGGILLIPYVILQFLHIRLSKETAHQSLDAGTGPREPSRGTPAGKKRRAPAAKKKTGKKTSGK